MDKSINENKSETAKRLEKEAEKRQQVRVLTPENCLFKATPGGFASLEYAAESYDRVSVYRVFPFSDPERYISVRTPDEKAEEIGIINNLGDFPDEQRAIIMSQINLRYFTPKIKRISAVKEEYGYSYWEALTDRGEVRFTVGQGGVVRISDTRVIITDIDGNRFEIPSVNRLNAKELRMIDLYL